MSTRQLLDAREDSSEEIMQQFAPVELAPHLLKPGLQLVYPFGEKRSIAELFKAGMFTKELFARYGFIIIDGYPIQENEAAEEVLLDKKEGITYGLHEDQQLHQDSRNQAIIQGYLSLRFPEQPNQRLSYTVIGEQHEVARRTFKFIERQGPHITLSDKSLDYYYQELHQAIHTYGSAVVGRMDYPGFFREFENLTWGQAIFCSRLSAAIRNTPFFPELNRELEGITYSCHWTAGRVLLLDNRTMVHGRRITAPQALGSYLLRRFIDFDETGVPFIVSP